MPYKAPANAYRTAIEHLCRYGDTDIFPHLPELAFFADEIDAIITELSSLDLDGYSPGGAIEALAPKSRFGFRIAHQLAAVDTLIFSACAIELGPLIETRRPDKGGFESFSYRFGVAAGGQVFQNDHTFRDWLSAQFRYLDENPKIATVIGTDISDFYARINFHRLENLLDECAPDHGAARFVKKHIKIIRAKQSFGLPVGGTAARLLAELALLDTDRALVDQGIVATRFVDDFRIFLGAHEDPYDALGFLAEQLGINEGLSLNVAKTNVLSREEYLDKLVSMTTDVTKEAEGVALEKLTADLYFDEEPNEEDIKKLKSLNLLDFLKTETNQDPWDVGKIKVIFRALKITKPTEAIPYVVENFKELVVFAKELCLLMQTLHKEQPGCFDALLDEVIEAILRPPASSVQVIRTWLLEIFVRGIIEIPASKVKRFEGLPSPMDKRQILLIRGALQDKNYFRKQKTAIDQFSNFEQTCLVLGARCLPDDEFDNWIATVKPSFSKPTGARFLKWARSRKEKSIYQLASGMDDHPD